MGKEVEKDALGMTEAYKIVQKNDAAGLWE